MPELHLSLLGGLEIGAEAAGPPLARKARAMLAYLAMHAGQPQSREKLAALFWGRNGDSQARTNLRQALSALRRALPSGNGAHLVTTGDRVALDLDGSGLDVARFEALAAGTQPEQLEQAAALYRGDLLDGFSLREEAFEEWAGAERERLRLVAVGALERLIAHYCDAQQFGRCAQAALRLLALDPLREDIHRALMRAYAAQSRVGLALKQYETCRDILRRELGVEPEPETRKLSHELRARRERSNDAAAAPRSATSESKERPGLLVLPFCTLSHRKGEEELADGLTEDGITALSKLPWLAVTACTSSLAYKGRAIDVRDAAREQQVRYVLDGSVRRSGDRIRVSAQLVDAADGSHLWAERYDRKFSDAFALQDELTQSIVATVEQVLVDAIVRPDRAAGQPGSGPHESLRRANRLHRQLSGDANAEAIEVLQGVLAAEPDNVAAHQVCSMAHVLNLACCWFTDPIEDGRRALEHGRAALRLAENDYLSHVCLGYASVYARDFEGAIAAARQGVSLNGNASVAIGVLGIALAYGGFPDEAKAHLARVLEMNPHDPCMAEYRWAHAIADLVQHNDREALQMAKAAALSKPDIATGHLIAAAALGRLGESERAHEAVAEARRCAPDLSSAWLRHVFPFSTGSDHIHLMDGLHAAGLPMEVREAASDARGHSDAMPLRAADPRLSIVAGPPLPEKPSVAVLAFENSAGDPDQAYFAEGITENIITGLTRFRDLFVIGLKSSLLARDRTADVREIGRQLGVAHVVEGSIRRVDDRVRITVQLIDAATTGRIWAEQYDRRIEEIFAVEDEITDVIVATLAGRIEEASHLRATRKPAREMAAYEHLLRARQCMRRYTKRDELAARSYLERALDLDPRNAAAFATLALSYVHEYESTWSEAPQAAVERAYELAREAVALDETDSNAHRAFAYAAIYRGLWEIASREIERAIVLNPNHYSNFCVKSWFLLFSGQLVAALACLDEGLRLNPFAPDNCYLSIGIAQYTVRRYAEAAQTFGRMSSWDTLRHTGLAACHGQLARDEEARAAAARLTEAVQAEFGGMTSDPMARWRTYVSCMFPFRMADDREHLREGLRKAGLSV